MRRSLVTIRPIPPVATALALFLCFSGGALLATEGKNVELQVGDERVRAYLVEGGSGASRPGVVVVHGWWGLNEQIRGVTERISELGYVAIVPDLYHGRLPSDLGYAHDFMSELDEDRVMRILKGAIQYLRSMPGASRRPVGMVGFDMGGELTLSAALRRLPVQVAISLYGDTRSDRQEIDSLQVPFLGIYAHDDRATPPDAVKQFESMLEQLGKSAKIIIMPDVGRYFTNEDRPGYDPEATASAWFYTQEFLASNLTGIESSPQRQGKGRPYDDQRIDKNPHWKKKPPPTTK